MGLKYFSVYSVSILVKLTSDILKDVTWRVECYEILSLCSNCGIQTDLRV